MQPGFKFFLVALAACLTFWSINAYADTATVFFNKGVSAFHAGNYKAALTAFLKARKLGNRSTNLRYDIGSTYFKLGRYREAAREFYALVKNPALASLAHYNLGLIALSRHDKKQAIRQFRLAVKKTDSNKIRALVRVQLEKLNHAATHFVNHDWVGFANLSGGYDSNASLLSRSDLIAASGKGSYFTQVLAGTVGQLTGTPEQGLRFISTLYHISYSSLSEYNQTLVQLGLSYHYPAIGWKLGVGGYANYSYLHAAPFERFNTLELSGSHGLTDNWAIRLRYFFSAITGAGPYYYLGGDQQQFGIQARWNPEWLDLRLGYRLDLNHRKNLTIGNQFYSASPTRGEFYLRANWPISSRIKMFLRTSYRHSRYNRADIFLSQGTLISKARIESRYLAAVGARYRLLKDWYLTGKFRHMQANSTFRVYSYKSNRYTLALEHYF
ncbi:tetratricopeptide repeat protein [Acidihalobacter prosperus]